MVELLEIKRSLQSPTLKQRREAVKQLELQLSSPLFLRQLDVNTVRLWPEDKIQREGSDLSVITKDTIIMSWPGLVDTYLAYMWKEVADHNKQLDATALKVLKTIFSAADNTARCGPGRHHLLRRAGSAFDKFAKVLEKVAGDGDGLGTALGKDICHILLKVLLPVPAYCQRASVESFQGLLDEAMLRFESLQQQIKTAEAQAAQQVAAAAATGRLAAASRSSGAPSVSSMQQQMYSISNLIAGLMAGLPGQLLLAFVVDLLAFLAQALTWLDEHKEYGRVSRQLMSCLNGLLLVYGADLKPQLPTTHKAVSSYIKHVWTVHTGLPLKEGVLCYCRLSLALGGVPSVGGGTSVQDLLTLVTSDINAPGFTWDLQHNKLHQQLAPLAAALYYHAAFGGHSATGAASSSTAAAAGIGGPTEVGSCGSTGTASGSAAARGQRGKRRASNGQAAAAAGGGNSDEGDGFSSDEDILQLPRKRSRVLGPAGQLLLHLQADPERWGPVTALLLHQYGPLLPPAFLAALQQLLAATLTRGLSALSQQAAGTAADRAAADGTAVKLDRRSASPATAAAAGASGGLGASGMQLHHHLLWLTWCLCELAACWPAVLHPLNTAAGGTGSTDGSRCSTPPAAAGAAGGVDWKSAGPHFDASEGACSQQDWPQAEVAAAQANSKAGWQHLWETCVGAVTAAGGGVVVPGTQEGLTWLLHLLVALKLVQLPSKAAAMLRCQGLWLPQQQQQGVQDGQDEQPVVLSDAQLALLLSLCLGQQVSSQKELLLRRQLLQACLSTAEAWCSGSRRHSRHSSRKGPGSMGPPAAVLPAAASSTAGKALPDLLLPAMLALLGAPGLPTPSLNGAPASASMSAAAAAKLDAVQSSWGFAAGVAGPAGAGPEGTSLQGPCSGSSSSSDNGAGTVWYAASETWWGADQQLEVQLAGLETGLEALQRTLAAQRLQIVMRTAAGDVDAGSAFSAGGLSGASSSSATPAAAEGQAQEQAGSSGWWKCWCQLADETAEHLVNALLPFTPSGQEDQPGWGTSQEPAAGASDAGGPSSPTTEPLKQLSYLLLLLNTAISLPCIAALQFRQHQQQLQQAATERRMRAADAADAQAQDAQGQPQARTDIFCGFGFSRHPEQHQQLQQLVMEAGIKAAQLLADNLHQLPCQPGSTWLQQLMHLGASLSRIQALMIALPTAQGPDPSLVKYQQLAAASFLAEVVKVMQRVTTQVAEAASAEPDEDMGNGAGGGADFDDDFMDAAPTAPWQGGHGSTQQTSAHTQATPAATFKLTQYGRYAIARPAGAAAAAGTAGGSSSSSGPVVFMGGGLAGFSGRAGAGLGHATATMSPSLLAQHQHTGWDPNPAGRGFKLGFAVGGLHEGLSGLSGLEGTAFRAFAALSPAYADTAQAVMRLWVHMAGLSGLAPPEAFLQAVMETIATCVCAGGWSHLQQLLGLLQGNHGLLSAQKVPHSSSHLILRLLQQVAAAAAAGGLHLDVPCASPGSQASQEAADFPSQQEPGGPHDTTYMSCMFDIFADVQKRLGLVHGQHTESTLPQSTQLQLALTTLALLQLQPQAVFAGLAAPGASTSHTGQDAGAMAAWRQKCLLGLLSSPRAALRARAGPLAVGLLLALPAAAAGGTEDSSRPLSVTALATASLAEMVGYIFLQSSPEVTQAQADRMQQRQAAQHKAAAGGAVLTATNREAQQEALAWEAAVVQLTDLACATTAVACVALQQQEPPSASDAQLIMLLLRHTASLQLLPDGVLPSVAVDSSGVNGSGQSAPSSGARAHAMRLAAAALDVMSHQQQYSKRYTYLHYHHRTWTREWVAAGCTVQQLLAVQPLICAPADAHEHSAQQINTSGSAGLEAAVTAAAAAGNAPAAGITALLQAYGSSLTFWLIFHGTEEQLAALAAAAGLQESELLKLFTLELCSCVYPMLKVPELKEGASRFTKKLNNTTTSLSQADSLVLLYSIFENSLPVLPSPWQQQQPAVPQQQPQQVDGAKLAATFPYITQAAADRSLGVIAQQFKSSLWLTALPIRPASVQELLLWVHRSLAAAAHPVHKLQRLGQVQCLLRQLPAAELQSPAVAHSLVSMLLQHLQVPELQGACCSCLHQLLTQLFDALRATQHDQGAAQGQQGSRKSAVTAKQQQQQQQERVLEELMAALLPELLPSTVPALVQCVEAAAGRMQEQQKLDLWILHPSAAPAAAAASALAAAPAAGSGCSAANIPPLDLPSTWAPVMLLQYILESACHAGLGILMDLLPPLPVLAAASRRQVWNSKQLLALVPWFARQVGSMSASSRRRAAQYLLDKLRQDPSNLFCTVAARDTQDGPTSQHQAGNREVRSNAPEGLQSETLLQPGMVSASFELARLGAELSDTHVMQLAAELLAVVGPMDPDVITLKHTAVTGLQGAGSTNTSSSGSKHTDRTTFPAKAVLSLLVSSLFDADTHIVSTAQATLSAFVATVDLDTLKQLLQPPARVDSSEAGNGLQAHVSTAAAATGRAEALLLQSYVSTYILSPGTCGSSSTLSHEATAEALEAAASAELWSPQGKQHKQWLCQLSSTLLRACGGVHDATVATRRSGRSAASAASIPATAAVLALLADAAALCPQLAELLLPFAVLKLCESDNSGADVPGVGSQGRAARLGAAAAAGLKLDSLSSSAASAWQSADSTAGAWASTGPAAAAGGGAAGGVDTHCYKVLLACLEHNRSVHQLAWQAMPTDPAPAAVSWHRCFCLHIDHLAVAAAAMAVKAYFTAMLYVEQWCAEVSKAGLNPFQGAAADCGLRQLQQLAGMAGDTADVANGVPSGMQAKQQQLLEQLLLECYNNVNEPDGVYAVVYAFGSPASQLQLLQHQQQWAAVLGGQDAFLQAAALQATPQHAARAHATGALTALQRLGCPATAQQCVAGALQQQQQQQHMQRTQPPSLLFGDSAGHLQQQQVHHQQVQSLLEAQQELAWRLSDWGLANSLNPADAQQGLGAGFNAVGATAGSMLGAASQAAVGPGAGSGPGQQGQGFHAAVSTALTALQQRDYEGFAVHVTSAQQGCVLQLASSSTQSAAAVNPLLVQLQMLQMLSSGLAIAKRLPAAAAVVTPAAADQQQQGAQEILEQLLPPCAGDRAGRTALESAIKLSGSSFQLSDQILSLQAALTKALHRPDALLATLEATMSIARKAGQVNFAAAALQQLQESLHQAVLGARLSAQGLPAALGFALPGGPGSAGKQLDLPAWMQQAVAADAGWALEAVKVRWLQGQHQTALSELQSLAAGLQTQLEGMYSSTTAANRPRGQQQTPEQRQAFNRLHSVACAHMQARMLLGKWLAAGEGSTCNIQSAMAHLQSASRLAPEHVRKTGEQPSQQMQALHSRVCYQLAVCADQHYQVLNVQLASPEFQKQQQLLQKKEQDLQQLKHAYEAAKNWQRLPAAKQASARTSAMAVNRRYVESERSTNLDKRAIEQLQEAHATYLSLALTAYKDCIQSGDRYDLEVVYRMCGMWFKHSDSTAVNEVMAKTFPLVPTAKFVPLVYQMASRMDNTDSRFQGVLTEALFRMARDHPYHCMYPLIALSNGDTEEGEPAAKNAHIRHTTNTAQVAAASALLDRLGALDHCKEIVQDMKAQVADLIAMTLQVHKGLPRSERNQVTVDQYTMPTACRKRLKSLQRAPPICYSLPIDPTRTYKDVPRVVEVDSTIKIAGGVNTPLIVRTTDDRGHTQRQLCKCNDDLRQDAVMQQFFGLVDTLLAGSPGAKQRRLGYRTYRVVPCSPLVGVLEWVEGTSPLTDYLLGDRNTLYNGGASARYHQQGAMTWFECFDKVSKAAPADLKDVYHYCCQHFPPVFRHFFLEVFPNPAEWFEARTRYTRSVAVASMAGAVIGLGDRHLGNILLDMHTAEVVHIDLGIAFEQGLFLQTPERVPFRLTANIVDGMGAAGVEGTFRRCCETTMQVLRENQEALLTVVQVVLHDPLYRWQMTPIKAGRKQLDPMGEQDEAAAAGTGTGAASPAVNGAGDAGGGGGGSGGAIGPSSDGLGNADAERAVLRVKQKLQGQDVEGGATLSVGAQVAAMMQAASDPDNLCRMYRGWAPWV